MNAHQMQEEIAIIKEMIEKTRKATAESGHLFMMIGVFSAMVTLVIGMLEINELDQFIMPAIIFMTIVNAFIGYMVAARESKKNKVTTYARTIFWNIWMVCGLTALLIVFVLPNLDLFPFRAVPVLVSLVMGIALFTTGIIFELRFVQWSSLSWWIGACLMAIIESPYKFMIMVATISFGWILPGVLLNRRYKVRSSQ